MRGIWEASSNESTIPSINVDADAGGQHNSKSGKHAVVNRQIGL
jgi:hypothetical protein